MTDTNDNLDTDIENIPDELSTLKARADLLGVKYHTSINVDKLRERVNDFLAKEGNELANTPKDVEDTETTKNVETVLVDESPEQKRARLKRHANELVRIRVTCMNPNKREWDGETFTAGNSLVGSFTKYVPFDNEEGWHVPRIILNQIVQRQCQVFTSVRTQHGTVRQGKLVKEFAIEYMDPLTPEELRDLAQRQALAGSIDK